MSVKERTVPADTWHPASAFSIRQLSFVTETTHFINTGFGWVCKHCSAEDDARSGQAEEGLARFFTEGESEAKEPQLSTPALARWRDATRQALVCPRCSIEETISKA